MVGACPAHALAASAGAEQGWERRGAAARDAINPPGWFGASRRG